MAAYDQYNPVTLPLPRHLQHCLQKTRLPSLNTKDVLLQPIYRSQLSFNWQEGGGTDKTFSCMSHVVLRSNYITFNYRTCSWLEEVTHHSFMNITSSLPSASPPPPTLCLLPNSIHDLLIEVRNNLIKQIPLLFSLHLLLTISRTRKYDCNLQWE